MGEGEKEEGRCREDELLEGRMGGRERPREETLTPCSIPAVSRLLIFRPHRKTQPPPVRARFAYPIYQSTNLLHSCTLVLLIGPPFLAGDPYISPLSACLRLDGDGSFSRIWSSGSGRPPPIRPVSPPLPQHIWPVVGRERSDLRPSIARRSRRRGGQASYRKGNVWISELALFEKFYRESARI